MASATGPDLDGARAAVEALMDDACVIRYDAQGRHDDQYDHATGTRIRPSADESVIYNAATTGFEGRPLADADETGGKCKIQVASASGVPRDLLEGGGQIPVEFYNVGLPWDAPIPPNGAVVEFVSSRRDDALVGESFTVRGQAKVGTFLVSRKMLAERRGAAL